MLTSPKHLPMRDPSKDTNEIPKKNACPGVLSCFLDVVMNLNRNEKPVKVLLCLIVRVMLHFLKFSPHTSYQYVKYHLPPTILLSAPPYQSYWLFSENKIRLVVERAVSGNKN